MTNVVLKMCSSSQSLFASESQVNCGEECGRAECETTIVFPHDSKHCFSRKESLMGVLFTGLFCAKFKAKYTRCACALAVDASVTEDELAEIEIGSWSWIRKIKPRPSAA